EKIVKKEAEESHLPDDAAELKKMLAAQSGTNTTGAPVDPNQKPKIENLQEWVRHRDETKARLATVDDELKKLPPFVCAPKATETPPAPKPPEEKPPVKPKEDR